MGVCEGDKRGGRVMRRPLLNLPNRLSGTPNPDVLRALHLNLSYVLHEPSTSPLVDRFARSLLAQHRRAKHATGRMLRWRDEEFIPRIVFRDEAAVWAFQRDCASTVLTIDMGATELLARTLRLVTPSTRPPLAVWHVDHPGEEKIPTAVPLFRGTALLFLPAGARFPHWFAILIFRPGWRSVLLDLIQLAGNHPVTALAEAIEHALRDYTNQWWGWRAWWDQPAEEVLPEFREGR